MKRTHIAIYALFALLLLHLVFPKNSKGEGSAQLWNPYLTSNYKTGISICNDYVNNCGFQRTHFAAYGSDSLDRLYFVVKSVDEQVYLGFNCISPGTGKKIVYRIKDDAGAIVKAEADFPLAGAGFIADLASAKIGPSQLFGAGGYLGLNWAPPGIGRYHIEFDIRNSSNIQVVQSFNIDLFDITVYSTTTNTAKTGRIYSYAWQLFENATRCAAITYIYSNDSVVSQIKFKGLKGGTWVQYCNQWGVQNSGFFEMDRQSLNNPGVFTYLPQYKIFVNIPDPDIFPPAKSAGQVTSIVPNYDCDDGTIDFSIETDKPGSIVLALDYDPPFFDRTYTIQTVGGPNTIHWDGLDGHGTPLPNNANIAYTVNYITGLTNLPLYDVEGNDSGFIVERILPAGPTPLMYWDDTQIVGGSYNFTGCLSNEALSQRCHPWASYPPNYTTGFGDNNLINTWWYSVAYTTNPVTIVEHRGPHKVELSSDPSLTPPYIFCAGTGGYGFRCEVDTNATEYHFSFTGTDFTIEQASTADTFMVLNFGNHATSGYLRVYADNQNCLDSAYMDSIYITIKPMPDITNPTLYKEVCNNTPTDITLLGDPAGAVFTWTATCPSPNVSGYASNAIPGNYINDLITNIGTIPVHITYELTPFYDGCYGETHQFIVNANPTPDVTINPLNSTLCSQQTSNINLTGVVPGTVFTWTATGSSGVIGGYSNGSGSSISQTLTNSSLVNGTVTYVVTPTINGCAGLPVVAEAIVVPLPSASVATSTTAMCSGETVTINITANIPGSTFAWNAVPSSGNVTGYSDGSGIMIQQTLHNTGYAIESVTYHIVPTANGCSGSDSVVEVDVYPIPNLSNNPLNQSQCNSTSTNLNLTSNVAGTQFTWTASGSSLLVTGYSNSVAPGTTINQTLVNSGFTNETVTYTIIPHANGCDGNPYSYAVTVYPTPNLSNVSLAHVQCNNLATGITLTSDVSGTQFTWTATGSSLLVSGFSNSVAPGTSINQTLVNSGYTIETVTYTITPHANGCDGTTYTYTVTVYPTPDLSNSPTNKTQCNNTATSINLTSHVAGTTFTWTATSSSLLVTGYSNSVAPGTTINQTLVNSGYSIETVTYSITPHANGCSGVAVDYVVTVYPVADLSNSPLSKAQCNDELVNLLLTSHVAGTQFTWTAVGSSPQVSGYADNAIPSIFIFDLLHNSGFTDETVTYTILPEANGCNGNAANFTVTVHPTPDVYFTPASLAICSNTSTNLTLSSHVAGASFTWTAAGSSPQVSGYSNSVAPSSTINQTLINSGFTTETVTYTITPSANGCTGVPTTYVVTVYPTPNLSNTPLTQSQCSNVATGILLTSDVAGTLFTWIASGSSPLVSGYSNSVAPGTLINQTLVNSGYAIETVTYTITPHANGCDGNSYTYTVTLFPAPNLSNTPPSQNQCNSVSTTLTLTSDAVGATFTWTATGSSPLVTGYSNSVAPATAINQVLVNSGFNTETVTYTITPHANGCDGTPTNFVVTVYPSADALFTPASETICTGQTTNVALSSHVAGSTFTYTAAGNNPPLSGFSGGTGNVIAQTIYSTSTLSEIVTYTVTPTANGCVGTPSNLIITVNPGPALTTTPLVATICDGATTNIALTSNVAGASFTWTASASSATVTGFGGGSGSTINQTLLNSGFTIETVTYAITPSASGCVGGAVNFVVTVNPKPDLSNVPASKSQCSNLATGITLTSHVAGTNFTWTAVGSSAQITGYTNNATPSTLINDVLFNTSYINQTATYTLTPHANGCPGDPVDYVVTVYPIADVMANPQTICANGITHIPLSSHVAGTTFAWTASASSGLVSGFSGGTGFLIAQTIASSSTNPETVTYHITPTSNTCTGTPLNVVVTINPTPHLTNSPLSSAICTGSNTALNLTSDVAGTNFTWTAVGSSPLVTGYSNSLAPGTTINQTLLNSGFTNETVTYALTPQANGCDGPVTNFVVTVYPSPNLSNTPLSHNQCNAVSTGINLTSNVAGANFTWTATGSSLQVTGYSNSVAPATTINQVLVNSGFNIETVTYTITPHANGCDGTPTNYVVTVYPSADVYFSPSAQTICTGQTTSILLASNVSGATFVWVATPSSGLLNGFSNGNGTSIVQTIFSTSGSVETVTYTATPTANGCVGTTQGVVVTVNPGPIITNTPLSASVCSGETTNINLQSNVPLTTYTWSASASSANVSGFADGAGGTIAQTLINSGVTIETVTYSIAPSANGCIGGSIQFVVTVFPTPDLSNIPLSQSQCNNLSTNLLLTSHVAGADFTWSAVGSSPQVSGYTNSAAPGVLINDVLVNSSFVDQTVTYTITPSANGCQGLPIDYIVTVYPTVDGWFNPSSEVICTGQTTNTNLFSNVAGATFSWTATPSSPLLSGFSNGSGSNIAQTLYSTSLATETVTYTATPSYFGCNGAPIVFVETVNPGPDLSTTPLTQEVCNAQTTNIVLTSNVAGTTFTWTATASSGNVGGFSAGGGSTIAQNLTNSGFTVETVTYAITPTASGCVGGAVDFVVTVYPKANLSNVPLSQNQCNAVSTGLTLTSDVAGATFTWTASGSSLLVTGFSNSVAPATTINQVLVNSGFTIETVTYTITPHAFGCDGDPVDYVVTVYPTANAIATPPADTICTGQPTDIQFTSDVAGTSFSWVATPSSPLLLSGFSNGSGTHLAQTIYSTSLAIEKVFYTITPRANNCDGTPILLEVVVNPGPDVFTAPPTQTICPLHTTNITLTSSVVGTTFSWTASASSPNVSGYSGGSGNTIVQTLDNTSMVAETVTYSISPSANGCVGGAVNYMVTINPKPNLSNNPKSQSQCNGVNTNIHLTSDVASTTFTWSATGSSPLVSGYTNNAAPLTDITDNLNNSGFLFETVTYSITPHANGCDGDPTDYVVTVVPVADVFTQPANPEVCSGQTSAILLQSNVAGTTYSWTATASSPLVTGYSNGSGGSIAQPILSGSIAIETITYLVTPLVNGCTGTPSPIVLTVNPGPVVTNAPMSQTNCSQTNTNLVLTSNVAGATYSWTASASSGNVTGYSNGFGGTISQVLTNAGFTNETVTYLITPEANGCIGLPEPYVVTVYPKPNLSNTPNNQAQCNNTSTAIALTSDVTGATFTWTATGSSLLVTGYSNSVAPGTTINQTLVNSGFNNETVTYTITPHANGCDGDPMNYVVTVYPTANVTYLPNAQTICTGQTTSINIFSSVANTTFSWTATPSSGLLSGYSAGVGNHIGQTILSSALTTETVTYTTTPSYLGCVGTPSNVVVTVNPGPDLTTTPLAQTICSGATITIPLTSTVPGATFDWSASSSSVLVSGFGNGSGTTIQHTLINAGFTIETVTYLITPIANGCIGAPYTYTVTVNPIPDISNTPLSHQQCNSVATGIALTSHVSGTTFTWSASGSSPLITGYSNGTGNSINQTLLNSGITNESVTYRITPTANGCTGPDVNYTVTVLPTPDLANLVLTQQQCNNVATNITLTSNVAGAQFTWSANGSSVFITGYTTQPTPSTYLNDVLINSGTTIETATYTIQPVLGSCLGTPKDYTVSVYPVSDVYFNPFSQAICNGETTNISLLSHVAATTYTWTASSSSVLVTGFGAGSGNLIAETLVSTSSTIETVTYVVTPSNNGCTGTPSSVVVTIYPEPHVTNTPLSQTICHNTLFTLGLTSNVASSTFTWSCTTSSPNLGGYSNGTGASINQALTNTGNTPETVTYHIYASANGCDGPSVDFVVTVNPVVVVTNTPLSSSICSGGTIGITLLSNVPSATFAWTASGSSANLSGFSNGAGGTIAQTLVNSGSTPETVTYAITPSAFGCDGMVANFVVTVEPLLTVTFTPPTQTICSGTASNIALTSNLSGANYTWTASSIYPAISGFSNGTGATIAQTILNLGNTPGTVEYIVTPFMTGCPDGVPSTFTLVVNPHPDVTNLIRTSSICSSGTTNITFTSNIAGATFGWTAQASSGFVTGYSNGSGSSVHQTLVNSGTNVETVTYIVVASALGCDGDTTHFQVMVNPVADIIITPPTESICPSKSTNFTLSSNVTGATFSWTATGSSGFVSGFGGGTGFTIAQTLDNTGINIETVTYLITSNVNGCHGNTSNAVATINPKPQITMPSCWDNIIATDAQPLHLRGGIPLNGIYSGLGVSGNLFYPAVAGVGTHIITYSYTNTYGCANSSNQTITVVASAPFTCGNSFIDVRDNQSYRSVQIGGQCWMADNLNFGNQIVHQNMQRDNCTPEKYCYNDNAANCTSLGGLYQWDELMKFSQAQGAQGLCPAGWHVPTHAEWTTLNNFFIAGGPIGSPINNPLYYGFNAKAAGAYHINTQWDYIDFATFFWTSTPIGAYKAWAHGMNTYNPWASWYPGSRSNGFSVRCIKD